MAWAHRQGAGGGDPCRDDRHRKRRARAGPGRDRRGARRDGGRRHPARPRDARRGDPPLSRIARRGVRRLEPAHPRRAGHRGSTGFGKRFVALDNGPFKREDSVKDIGAFLDRLAADPRIDPRRIAETGGSYGGYMCYAVAIRYGDRLKAANCIVAISNFVTFLQNTQSYRRDLRRVEYGDERDPAQRARLTEISPLTHARELRIPLMVVTGGNDPRVPPSEAEQMVAAVRANGVPAWHLLARDEGHGFAKKENADYQFWTGLQFWQANLLGGAK